MEVTDSEFEYIRTWVKKHTAVDLAPGRTYLVESRLDPVINSHGLNNAAELISKLKLGKKDQLYDDVVDAMTTHESFFFRDVHPFQHIQNNFIPNLIKSNSAARRLGVWSIACSTGQEIYSVAMIIREHFPQLRDWKVDLYATDISQPVIDKAKKGVYSQSETRRGLSEIQILQHFNKNDFNHWGNKRPYS